MKKTTFVSIVALATFITLGFAAPLAFATPSTQIWIPSTDTQPVGTVHLGVDNYTTMFKKTEDGGGDLPVTMGATFGVADTSLIGVEVGLDLREPTNEPVYFNAKIQLKEDSLYDFFPAIAIGGYDFGSDSESTDYNIIYILAAKTFPVFGRLSLGYYSGNEDLMVDAKGNVAKDGFLASYDRTLAEIDDRLWVAVDYMSGENAYGALSFGVAWRFSPNIGVLVGYDMFNEVQTGGENKVTIQFDMDF